VHWRDRDREKEREREKRLGERERERKRERERERERLCGLRAKTSGCVDVCMCKREGVWVVDMSVWAGGWVWVCVLGVGVDMGGFWCVDMFGWVIHGGHANI